MLKGESNGDNPDEVTRLPESYDVFKMLQGQQERHLTPEEKERAEEAGRFIALRTLVNGNTWVTVKSLQRQAITKSVITGIQHGWDVQNGGDGSSRNLKNSGLQVVGANRIPRQEGRLTRYLERLGEFEPSSTQKRLAVIYDVDSILKFQENPEVKDVLLNLFTGNKDITWVVVGPSKPRDLRGIEPDSYVDFVMSMKWGVVVDNDGVRESYPTPVTTQQASTRPQVDAIIEKSSKNDLGGTREINRRVN